MTEKKNKGGIGNPFVPTEEQRAIVERAAGNGLPHRLIATLIGVALETLDKHFTPEMERGKARAADRVTTILMETIETMKGTREGLSAAIFYCKAQLGWSEKQRVELTGADGEPFKVMVTISPKGGNGNGIDPA